jgi:hypothetical protein
MPPKGDRPSAAALAKDKASKSAAPAAKDKGAAAAPAKGGLGGFTSFKDMFDGGGPGQSKAKGGAPDSSPRARARPDVVKTGTGKDMRYMDTRTGQSFAAPEYGAFSFRGLTSTDPANVARNRYGAERAMAAQAERDRRDGPDRSGIASLVAPAEPTAETPAAPTPAELAMIGAPTTPMAPTFVDSPVYGRGVQNPAINYGTAFMGVQQMTPMNFLDIFAAYPNLGMR